MSDQYIVEVDAVADLMPPKPDTLRVTAKIRANEGQTAVLKVASPQGINPTILILDVELAGRGGTPTEIEASYRDDAYDDRYEQVTVRYMDESSTMDIQRVR